MSSKNETVYRVQEDFKKLMTAYVLIFVCISCPTIFFVCHFWLKEIVVQAIAMGFVKNLDILSSTLATLKEIEWESHGNYLSTTASQLSDLISDPEQFLDPSYMTDNFITSISDMVLCESDLCSKDGHEY